MERIKVNNIFYFFLIRYFATISLCFLTLIFTGRIADMDFLIGNIEYSAGGVSTLLARNIFSSFAYVGNIYAVVSVITGFASFVLYILLRNFIDKNNINLWKLCLLCPGLLIYTNSGTKETLFLYPAILFIILEIDFLLGKNSKTESGILNFFTRIGLLSLMFTIRGDLAIPYIVLSFILLFLKYFYIGRISHKLSFNKLIIIAFLISIIVIIFVTFIYPDYIERIFKYLSLSFENQINIYRSKIDVNLIKNPLNSLQIQYLSLFPTPLELLNKPYKLLIVGDSFLLIYSFTNSWKLLFKSISSFKVLKKLTSIIFIYIAVIYFSIYGILGSFNLGSSQRLRMNFFPLGIIFPLILEKRIRNNQRSRLL